MAKKKNYLLIFKIIYFCNPQILLWIKLKIEEHQYLLQIISDYCVIGYHSVLLENAQRNVLSFI